MRCWVQSWRTWLGLSRLSRGFCPSSLTPLLGSGILSARVMATVHISLMCVSRSFQIENAVWIVLSFHVPGPGPEWEVATVSMGSPSRFPFEGINGMGLWEGARDWSWCGMHLPYQTYTGKELWLGHYYTMKQYSNHRSYISNLYSRYYTGSSES